MRLFTILLKCIQRLIALEQKQPLELLWENPDPTKDMDSGAQIKLKHDDYDFLLWLSFSSQPDDTNNSPVNVGVISKKGYGTQLLGNWLYTYNTFGYRTMTRVDDVTFTAATTRYINTGSQANGTSDRVIPYQIYGFKL